MGRGGARPGSGRKPGPVSERKVLTLAVRAEPVVVAPPTLDEGEKARLLEPPEGLSVEAQPIWRRLAGHAITERTLTPSTAAGFGQLCQQWVYLVAMDKKIRHLGPDTKEASPYFLNYLKLAQRLDASLARFKLTAFGKPAVLEKPKAAANPWAQVGAK